jgi:hypothetical protein
MTNRIKAQTSNDVNFGVVDVSAATFLGYVYQERQLRRWRRKKSINKNYGNKYRFQFKGKNYTDTFRARYKTYGSMRVTNPGDWFEFRLSYYEVLSSFAFGLELKNLV